MKMLKAIPRQATFLTLIILLITSAVTAKEVLWADKVIEVSSEFTGLQYSALQALGKPNVLPVGGESPNAWQAAWEDRESFIKVGFENAIRIQQIAIAESFNPSAVKEVYAYDANDNEYLIYELTPGEVELKGRLLNIFFDLTSYEVAAIKVVIDGKAVPGFNAIDAIGISDSKDPIETAINVSVFINADLVAERLSTNINSDANEIKPLITPDEKILYFSRQYHPDNVGGIEDKEDIWYSELDESGEWGLAKNLGSPLNNAGPNFIGSITPDGKTILLGNQYLKNGKMGAGVSTSTKTSEGWSDPVALKIKGDHNYSTKVGYYMANNRKVMLISSERDDSYGDRDIYVSFLEDGGDWSEPLNLGTDVNTADEESSPFLAADDKTLYFSTPGYSGFGENDIFVARRLDDSWQSWSAPENLGPSINSEADDKFFNIPSKDGEYAYFSRGVAANDNDIFRLTLPDIFKPDAVVLVKGKVYDTKTGKPLSAKISYEKLPSGEEIGITSSDPVTGAYEILLPSGSRYGYLAKADGYASVNANIDVESTKEYREVDNDLGLVPIEVGQVVRLNNIFFDTDMAQLKEESYPELERTVQFMKENSRVEIQIAGHTDNIGSSQYNKALSERRAKAVYSYLINNGVSSNRMSFAGFGENQPIASNDDEDDGRAINRRVEFKIVKS